MTAVGKHLPLLLILVAAAALRLLGLNWDEGHHLHPDERFIAIVEGKIGLPGSIAAYFDTARSPLNPYNNGFDGFAYGTLPLFVARWLAEVTGFAGYDRVVGLGRLLSALADLGTVVFVYALARLVYGRPAALAAACIAAFSVLHIQLAHFFAFDTFLTFFVAWSLYFAQRAWMRSQWTDFVLLGLGVGLATACKISAVTLAPILVLACVLPWRGRSWPGVSGVVYRLGGVGLAALLAYRLAEPYAFLGTSPLDVRPNPKFIADMINWVKISSGEVEVPYMIQWANTPKYTFALDSIIRWGLGPAAGLASLGGLVLAGYRLPTWGWHARHLLLVFWAVLNLAYFGGQFAKFMRYLLPLYPALAVLAGYFVSACVSASRQWWGKTSPTQRWAGRAMAAIPLLVLLPTVFWAIAFVQIYAQPNTRVAASRWLMDNVPDGAVLATEHWDDELPLGLPGRDRKTFHHVSMNLYDDENPEKLKKLLENLSRADYLILASNRLSGSIPRLPTRYPLATEYYRALFDGRLGYVLVAEFTSRPNLFGVEINDDGAQEDFTVYDHPKVQVFQRAPSYQPDRVATLLGSISLDQIQRVKPVEGAVPRAALLTPEEWSRVQRGGTWSALFDPENLANHLAPALWWIVGSLLGLAAWPLMWRLCPNLADGGYGLARVTGLLVVAYVAWLLASLKLAPFGRPSLGLGLMVLVVASAIAVYRSRSAFRAHLRRAWPVLLASEAAFSAGFGICLGMRLVNPDLWHANYGGEKPMDFAFLNAVIKSDYFPPYDPWFAGGTINYYYFGFVLVAGLVKLTGIVPAIAYNLALALWFGLVCQTAFSAGANLLSAGRTNPGWSRSSLAAGGLAVLFIALAGNLDGAAQLRDGIWKAGGPAFQSGIPFVAGLGRTFVGLVTLASTGRIPEFDFWRSTRLIGPEDPGPIHEFPFFSFLYADLHAHILALPFTLAVLVLSIEISRSVRLRALLRSPLRQHNPGSGELARFAAVLALLALLVGALRASNTWDFPTYLAVALLGLACLFWPPAMRYLPRASLAVALCGVAILAASSVLFQPYLQRYQLFYSGVDLVRAHTAVWQWLTIQGLWLFILASYVAVAWVLPVLVRWERNPAGLAPSAAYYSLALPMTRTWPAASNERAGAALVALVALAIAAVGYGPLALSLMLAAGLLALAWLRRRSREQLFVSGLVLLGLAVLAIPEVVAIRGDIGRMNTVFKFYYQAWTLLGVVSAVWLVRLARLCLRRRARRGSILPPSWRWIWLTTATLLVVATLIYPLRAAPSRLTSRFGPLPPSLDGMAFMQKAVYRDRDQDVQMPADHAAIRWLQANVVGSPVLLEANTGLYKWGSRVSVYTGLPTVVGWDWHEKQQRVAMASAVDERLKDVKTIFETPRLEQALPLLRKYNVAYIYVGGLERIYYPAAGLRKFEEAPTHVLQPVYQAPGVTIYRIQGPS